MPEYIEREAAIAIIEEKQKALCLLGLYGRGYASNQDEFYALQEMIDQVNCIPSADVAPVVHGRWESHLMPLAYKCSVCKYKPSAEAWRFHTRNYCPNCGAKMDGEEIS